MKRNLLHFLFLFVLLTGVHAANYYVDATGGSDSAAGTSTDTAWQTLGKVNTAIDVATIVDGDSIFLKRGEVFAGLLDVDENNLVFDAYGSGARPLINATGNLRGIDIRNTISHIAVRNIDINGATNEGVFVYTGGSDFNFSYMDINRTSRGFYIGTGTITDVNISHVQILSGVTTYGYYSDTGTISRVLLDDFNANYIGSTAPTSTVSYGFFSNIGITDLNIFRSSFSNDKNYGIGMATGTFDDVNLTDVNISNNNFTYGIWVGGNMTDLFMDRITANYNNLGGIYLNPSVGKSFARGTIKNSVLNYNGRYPGATVVRSDGFSTNGTGDDLNVINVTASFNGNDGFGPAGSWTDVNISYSMAEQNGIDGSSSDGDGYSYHTGTTGSIIYSVAKNNFKSAVAQVSDNTKVYMAYNLFYHETNGTIGLVTMDDAGTYWVYNNTIFSRGTTGTGIDLGTTTTADIKNNIVIGFNEGLVHTGGTTTENYNLIYGAASANWSGLSQGANSISADPRFVNSDINNFALRADSPARNTGTNLGFTIDFNGNPIVGNPDMGYLEYQNIAPDANIVRIESVSDNADSGFFSYARDGNLTIDLNIQDDSNGLRLDLNYSSSASINTGTAIVTGLDLNSLLTSGPRSCADTNFYNSTRCSIDWNISSVADGNYFLHIRVTDLDSGSDQNTSDRNIGIDTTKPSTSWDGNHATWQKFDSNIHLTCTDTTSGCATTRYRLDTDSATGISYGSWQTYDTNILVSSDGNWAIDFNSTDNVGNIGDTNTFYILVDKTNPTTSWDGNHNTWQKTDSNIHLTCTDANSGCNNTKYRLDTDSATAISYGAWQTYDSNIFINTDGNWAIDFNSTDNAGNIGDTNTFYVLVDKTAPSTSWDGNHNSWQKFDSNIHLTCTDSNSGCGSIRYRLDTDPAVGISYGAWQAYDTNILVSSDGNWAIDFNSTDNAGNIEDINTLYVLVDKNAPSVSISSPADGSSQTSNSVTLQYAGVDANSGIAKYWVRVGTVAWIDNSTTTSYTFSNLADGTHVFTVIATDNADNNSSDANVTVTISGSSNTNTAGGGWPSCAAIANTTVCSGTQTCQGTLANASDTRSCCIGTCIGQIEPTSNIEWRTEQTYFDLSESDLDSALDTLSEAAGFSGFSRQNAIDLTAHFSFVRTLETAQISAGSQANSSQTTIRLAIRNNSDQTQTGRVLFEQIPKNAVLHASDISTTHPFQIIQDDPIVAFLLPDLIPNQEYTIEYTLPTALNPAFASLFQIPILSSKASEPSETTLYNIRQVVVPLRSDIVRGLNSLRLGMSSEVIDAMVSLNERIVLRRGITVKSIFDGNKAIVTTTIDLVVKNTSGQEIENLTVTEFFPSELSLNLDDIKSRQAFTKLESQRAIQFAVAALSVNAEKKWSYVVEQEISDSILDRFPPPLVTGTPKPVRQPPESDGKTIPSGQTVPAGFLTNFWPVLLAVLLAIAVLFGANYWRQKNRKKP